MSFLNKFSTLFEKLKLKNQLDNLFRFQSNDVKVTSINKILIANRSEIGIRVINSAHKMGIQTVAVFSDVDRDSLFVQQADEAYNIGTAPSLDSYLRMDRVIQAAHKSGAQAIHPGYGFLSENMEFAELCEKEGIIFIGPPASAIRDMGIKSTSKHIMSSAGVPIIEGYHGEDQSNERLSLEADRIGFPVMIKAVRGGGGKGMRIAKRKEEFLTQLESSRNEALKSYNDTVVLLEKYVDKPRHVEVQIFGDKHGNYVYLFERDCSVQRRHQKIIEEAPAPHITKETRKLLGEAAVKAAMAVNYVGAGTVEFIMDENQNFYFMEMNTRLQVEHPVTEMITKTDLVKWQILIASGRPLPLNQSEITFQGHAFEGRIYAEDPRNNFMPGAGPLHYLNMPSTNQGVRIETGVREGDEVTVHYDPMIAKLVVWDVDRRSALIKFQRALREYNIVGLSTNIKFLDDLAGNEEFQKGNVHTGFIDQHYDKLFPAQILNDNDIMVAAMATILIQKSNMDDLMAFKNDPFSPFISQFGKRLNYFSNKKIILNNGKDDVEVEIKSLGNNNFKIKLNNNEVIAKASLVKTGSNKRTLEFSLDDFISKCSVVINNDTVHLFNKAGSYQVKLKIPNYVASSIESPLQKGARSPMPGVVDKIFVKEGDRLKAGDPIATIIAMKMEYIIKAVNGGLVKEIFHKVGNTVKKHEEIVEIEEDE